MRRPGSALLVDAATDSSAASRLQPDNPMQAEYYQMVLAMVFAINEINRSPNLLPNTTLGFYIYDSCFSELGAIAGTLQLISGGKETIPNYSCQSSPKLAGFIGDGPSAGAVPMARMLGVSWIPQISYAAALPILSDKVQFPSFLRTVTSVASQPHALVQLLLQFDWTWIGILASDNDLCRQGSQALKDELERNEICTEFFEILPLHFNKASASSIIDIVKRSTVKVIVCYTFAIHITPILQELALQKVSGKIWIGVTSWIPSFTFSRKDLRELLNGTLGLAVYSGDIPGFRKFLNSIHPLKQTEDIFMKTFWEQAFSCKWEDMLNETQTAGMAIQNGLCTGTEKLESLDASVFEMTDFRFSYSAYKAIYALAQALQDLIHCSPQEGPFIQGSCADPKGFQPWQMLHYVKNVHLLTSAGRKLFFDESGDSPPFLDLLYWHMTSSDTSSFVKMGTYDANAPPGVKMMIDEQAILWGGKNYRKNCELRAYIDWRSLNKVNIKSIYSLPLIPVLRDQLGKSTLYTKLDVLGAYHLILVKEGDEWKTDFQNKFGLFEYTVMPFGLYSLDCLKCPSDHWSNDKKDRCMPKRIEFLSYEEPLGFTLASIAIFLFFNATGTLSIFISYRDTPLVRANNLHLSYILLVALMLSFLSCLVFIGRPSPLTCMLRQVTFGIAFSVAVSCVMAKTIVVVTAFRAIKPNSAFRRWSGTKTSYLIVMVCTVMEFAIGVIWLGSSPPFPELNNSVSHWTIIVECNEGSFLMFYCILAFLGVLAFITFGIAFMARNLPDTFNEAKFITFSMLVFISVWLSFIPAYLSTKAKYLVAVEIFAILSSGAGLMYCIFAPKMYIIMLRPELNTRECLVRKSTMFSITTVDKNGV
ncbi:extracellular calcium-sensing receptor-like [Pleurodeles waltl]|uniref:extracellular calcium-sensing receptor-like n=1 Tax=Pleurodeles waltl TaxID=8319 RepID=UPI003709B6BC